MKLNRFNFEQYEDYSSKFVLKIQRYVDFIADFKDVKNALRLRHRTHQFGTPALPKHAAAFLG